VFPTQVINASTKRAVMAKALALAGIFYEDVGMMKVRDASSGLGTHSPYLSPLSPLRLACGVSVALHHASLPSRVATGPGDDADEA
jgi:hypothetical protein